MRAPCRRICVGCLIECTQRRTKHWIGAEDAAAVVLVRSRALEELEAKLQVRLPPTVRPPPHARTCARTHALTNTDVHACTRMHARTRARTS